MFERANHVRHPAFNSFNALIGARNLAWSAQAHGSLIKNMRFPSQSDANRASRLAEYIEENANKYKELVRSELGANADNSDDMATFDGLHPIVLLNVFMVHLRKERKHFGRLLRTLS